MARWGHRAALLTVIALLVPAGTAVPAQAAGEAPGAPGGGSSWTAGGKVGLGTSTTSASKVWFTVGGGIATEMFYPRADLANVQDMQYIVSDGSSFVDLERDATTHAVSMPDERALEYTITNTARNGRYRLTHTYLTDPARATVLVRTRFQSLDGGSYQLYLLYNPSLAGGAGGDTGGWDSAAGALVANDSVSIGGSTVAVASSVVASVPFSKHSTGYSGTASDGYVDIAADRALTNQYDTASTGGNIVQVAQVPVAADTTFSLALGFAATRAAATTTAKASLTSGFTAVETSYRSGWDYYIDGLAVPASVSADARRRRVYRTSVMALKAAEDKTYPGASVASLSTPWGDTVDGWNLNDGYHRVWARDLYQQASALIAAGDRAQATRMTKWLWDKQWIPASTPGDWTQYELGSFPRYSPVSGVAGATPQQLGCCEQLDQDAFPIILAWQLGLGNNASGSTTVWDKVRTTANHIVADGPRTRSERWEEQGGMSPSTIAAEIAGLVRAAEIVRKNDAASADRYLSKADEWRAGLDSWTVTSNGYFGDHNYYERIESADVPAQADPNDTDTRHFEDGDWWERDIIDSGFLDLVRLGVRPANHPPIAGSLAELDAVTKVATPLGAMWYRYNHDSYGESQADGTGWPAGHGQRTGRLWPLLSGERGEYELAAGRSATSYLQTLANAANDGYLIPEQAWDRADAFGFTFGRPTNSAAPLNWAAAQYVRLALSIDAGKPVETPSVVSTRYAGKP